MLETLDKRNEGRRDLDNKRDTGERGSVFVGDTETKERGTGELGSGLRQKKGRDEA